MDAPTFGVLPTLLGISSDPDLGGEDYLWFQWQYEGSDVISECRNCTILSVSFIINVYLEVL